MPIMFERVYNARNAAYRLWRETRGEQGWAEWQRADRLYRKRYRKTH